MPEWTDKSKAELVKQYLAQNPTPKTTTEIMEKLAPDFDATINGVRRILGAADAYVKVESASKATATTTGEKKETKQESLDRLTGEIEALGLEADDTIVSKLTGKAAAYFADVIKKATAEEED